MKLAFAILAAAIASAASTARPAEASPLRAAQTDTGCTLTVSPARGRRTSSFELRGTWPEGTTEVRITIYRVVGRRLVRVGMYWVNLAPGERSFRGVFFHKAEHGKLPPLRPGRYRAVAESNHTETPCRASASFSVG